MTTNWTDRAHHGVPYGAPTQITLTVSGDDHPGAIVTALKAPRALAAYQHLAELPTLPADDLRSLLIDVHKLAGAVAALEDELIVSYKAAGASWGELQTAMELRSRQTAKDRHHRVQRAADRGLNTSGLTDATSGPDGAATVTVTGSQVVIGCHCKH